MLFVDVKGVLMYHPKRSRRLSNHLSGASSQKADQPLCSPTALGSTVIRCGLDELDVGACVARATQSIQHIAD
jgi:hypothetical protein